MELRQKTGFANRMVIVIVIEDDQAVRNSLKFSLEIEGFTIREYADAGEFLKETAISDAGCLVIDYNLPEMNGLDMLDHLRDRHVGVPAILITSCPNAVVRRRAAEASVPIVEKPLLGNALVQSIQDALAR